MTRLFVDMDGVLADFERHHEAVFGWRPVRDGSGPDVDWEAVRQAKDFYLAIPPMVDMQDLWARIHPSHPIVLTGVPHSVPEAPSNKIGWVRKHLGEDVEVHCCPPRNKARYCLPGDVLIDDYTRYKRTWEQAGGIFILHRSAAETISVLDRLNLGV